MKKYIFCLIAVTAMYATSCKDDGKNDLVVPVTGVTIEQAELLISPGNNKIMRAVIEPDNATNKGLIWSSSNEIVAKIDSVTGELAPLALGAAVITVTTDDGGFSASRNIKVTNVPVTGVMLPETEVTLAPGAKKILTAIVLSVAATNKSVTWSSDKEAVAVINSATGELTAKAVGESNITATTVENGFTASCKVMVELVNLLVNPGFENPDDGSATLDGWTIINGNSTWFANYYGVTNPAVVPGDWNADRQPRSWFDSGNGYDVRDVVTGKYACRIAAGNTSGIYQLVNVTPGTSYMFGADIAYRNNNTANQKIKNGETIKILSVNGNYPSIGEVIIPIDVISSSASTAYSISMGVTGSVTIPAGINQVRFQIDQRQYNVPDAAPLMIIDNCIFTQLPE